MTAAGNSIQSVTPTRHVNMLGREQLTILLFLLASSIFLFVDPKVSPVALQDEARNAINALEMYIRGYSLITTFNFQPDLWNTKPPLLIWLMSASMSLFGPSEWAIRLPSAVAALGILLSTLLFTRRVTGSLPVAVTAASMLVLSPGFFGEHGARTADFDATLTFFVTGALQLIFVAVHRRLPSMRLLLLIGGLVAAGALTKSIAAFIPVSGVVVYLIAVRRLKRVLSCASRYSLAVAVSIVPLLSFYALREAAGPGYLNAVIHNDLAGRFNETLIRPTSPFFYVTNLAFGWCVAGPLLLAAPVAVVGLSSRTRLLFVYAASIVSFSMLVYSAASNRALQYALPIFPWMAIIGALTLRHLGRVIANAWAGDKKPTAIAFAAMLTFGSGLLVYQAADWRYRRFPERDFYPQSSYGDLFAELTARGATRVTVVDPGNIHLGNRGYAPLLRWNQLIWQRKGLEIDHELEQRAGIHGPLASCQPTIVDRWRGGGAEKIGSCAVLWHVAQNPRTATSSVG
jgi:4-amino-4-deoxy-L-arabinose transferase-like glycosyltransferase